MEKFDLVAALRKSQELMEKSFQLQYSFLQNTLLASSGVLSIAASLFSQNGSPAYIRAVFATSMVLLTLGILTNATTLYKHKELVNEARKEYSNECIRAHRECRAPKPLIQNKDKVYVFCERATYILLPLAVVTLAIYSVLSSLVD